MSTISYLAGCDCALCDATGRALETHGAHTDALQKLTAKQAETVGPVPGYAAPGVDPNRPPAKEIPSDIYAEAAERLYENEADSNSKAEAPKDAAPTTEDPSDVLRRHANMHCRISAQLLEEAGALTRRAAEHRQAGAKFRDAILRVAGIPARTF